MWNPEIEVYCPSCEAADGFKRVCMWVFFNFIPGKPREITSLSFSFTREAWQHCSQNHTNAKLKILSKQQVHNNNKLSGDKPESISDKHKIHKSFAFKMYSYCIVQWMHKISKILYSWMYLCTNNWTSTVTDLVNCWKNSLGHGRHSIPYDVCAYMCTQHLYIQQTLYMFTLFQGVSSVLVQHVVTWR